MNNDEIIILLPQSIIETILLPDNPRSKHMIKIVKRYCFGIIYNYPMPQMMVNV